MVDYQTWPDESTLLRAAYTAPDYMVSDLTPYAVWVEGMMSDEYCARVSVEARGVEPYIHEGCDATTRELGHDDTLESLAWATRIVNQRFFNYDLNRIPMSWHQTYEKDSSYQEHMDGAPGVSRKLTAILLLSEPDAYSGGDLMLSVPNVDMVAPRTRGTVIWIPPWLHHRVNYVHLGHRESINMGFFGPPFR